MTLHDYATALRKHWVILLVLTVLGAALGYTVSQFLPPQYRSGFQAVIEAARGDNASELVQGANYVQSLVPTYLIIASSPTVLQPVIEELELTESPVDLARRVDVSSPLNTKVIDVRVTDPDPKRARAIADAIAEQLRVTVEELSPQDAEQRPAVRSRVIAPARVPEFASEPDTKKNVALGAAAGLGVAIAYALLRRRYGSRLMTGADIIDTTDTPLIGEIGRSSDGRSIAATMRSAPDGRIAESLRQLTASLKFLGIDEDRRVILITSAAAGEGKSSVSMGLALTLAEMGHSVLYVEADMRRPSAARYTQLEDSVGLTTVLLGEATLAEAVQPWGHPGLSVLTSGVLPPNPGQVISSGQLTAIIRAARANYDYVIIDTAPVLAVSDAQWLAPLADGTLLVARANVTKRQDLRQAIATFNSNAQDVLGVVLNDVRRTDRNPYYAEEALVRPTLRRQRREGAGA